LIRETQEQANWCWAACVRMAASHFGMPAPEQCTLASEFIPGAVACCIDGSTDACDQSLDAAAIPALYKAVILFADALGSDALPVTEPMVRNALANGIVLLLLNLRTSFHFILVDDFVTNQFQVTDPKYIKPFLTDWSTINQAYGLGNIEESWHIRPR